MSNEKRIKIYTQQAINRLKKITFNKKVILGWDGFVDNVWHLVEERNSATDYQIMESMLTLNQRIKEVAGGGLSTEILKKDQRAGGFSANTGRVLGKLGIDTTLISLFGDKKINKRFSNLVEMTEVISLGDPCIAHIFEFADGKLMFPANQNIRNMDWEKIKNKVGLAKLIDLIEEADLIGLGYWANMPYYHTICKGIKKEVGPKLSRKSRQLFMDFGNVKKRSAQDLAFICSSLSQLEEYFKLTLSFNRSELLDTAKALGIVTEHIKMELVEILDKVREKTRISNVVVHTNRFAASSNQEGIKILKQPYCENPVVTTGAGDTFNGGYILGLLCSNQAEGRLAIASGTAGYFIRNGIPPSREELISFLIEYPSYFNKQGVVE
ncbi:hypothetical protein GM661_18270 [Iocasia frigidifontis]|uniref:Carbohydrate kinase PfkB domain-containing protein n=1 Tax=Iocasia fonsfrigidae TaxID=2682810 RepID=A0A8A7KEC3_9FIRM|nr:carbohydrate kinase family protein [Iocasia fonsfrigidae]QTL99761.1 hypothetical protein GM661_18270 [Iocasia fonsfrigidae]